ncbi:MAG TPA: hypothetical protein VGL72_07645 [Bryobacteraceae bacterium]|jgi:hypothetical protein
MATTTSSAPPDPTKHVNYTLGMLLGVDDFNQEFAYLSGRDKWMARDLDGYGTLCGLKVSLDSSTSGPRISVSCGTALSPRGQMICLHPAQCAYLKDWLSANQSTVLGKIGSPLGLMLNLWLVICYRECPADSVPIAGEPCRAASDLMAPSRWVDGFRLDFRLAPPEQPEEDAIRDFVAWIDQVQITDIPGFFPTLEQFVDELRATLLPVTSPIDPGSYFQIGSPLNAIHVHPANADQYLRAAFRIWATEIRPVFHTSSSQACTCTGETPSAAPTDECLLLAEVQVPVVNIGPGQNWVVDDAHPVVIDESRRPILLHSRMLQEWMQSGLRGGR